MSALFSGSARQGSVAYEITYLLFRAYCGISIAIGAGLSKVFHKIDEEGSDAWSNLAFGAPGWFIEQVGEIGFTFPSPTLWAYIAIYGEFVGGLFVALGLFTRFSALQLAFQFFVVSFIWYDSPELFAMYYQQLIFWTFALITVLGGGRYSLDAVLANRRIRLAGARALPLLVLLAATPLAAGAQAAADSRVSFVLANPSLKTLALDIRHFDGATQRLSGYGYELGPLATHAVNMPAGARLYQRRSGKWELYWVVSSADDGRRFDMGDPLELSREQCLQAARDEYDESIAKLEKAEDHTSWEAEAVARGLEMITFAITGKTPWGRQVYVRVALPFESGNANTGFSRSLSAFQRFRVSYPVGTRLYLCEGPYWNGPAAETLLLTVTPEQRGYLIRI